MLCINISIISCTCTLEPCVILCVYAVPAELGLPRTRLGESLNETFTNSSRIVIQGLCSNIVARGKLSIEVVEQVVRKI